MPQIIVSPSHKMFRTFCRTAYQHKNRFLFPAVGIATGLFVIQKSWHSEIEESPKWYAAEAPNEPYVFKVVLTGGPCGGKSTAMSQLSERLQSLGYQVYLVPEVATLLITNGVSFANQSRENWLEIETQIMRFVVKKTTF